MAESTLPFPMVHDAGRDLARRTVCIKVERHQLGNSKKVNSSQVEVDSDRALIRVTKFLWESKEYTAIRNFDGEITRYLEEMCLPFERGIHLCPLPLLKQVDAKMHEFSERRYELVEAFVAAYPELCETAASRCVRSTTHWTILLSSRSGPRSPLRGDTSASVSPSNGGRSRQKSGLKSGRRPPAS
jgi:hypothetical protein